MAEGVRVGVVGCGMGRNHAHAYRLETPRCNLVWVADVDEERARAIATEVGCRAIADWTAGLDEVDAISICTPNHLHAPQAIAAMRRGKHVLLEKPMATAEADCLEMIDVADAFDVRLMVNYSRRYRPALRWLQRAIAEVRYGRPFKISAWTQSFNESLPADSWRLQPQ